MEKLHSIYMYYGNATKVCPPALSPWYSTTNTLITQRNLLAFVPSTYLKTFPLSVISFREFSSRISVRQKLHHCVNAIIKREEHYHGLCN